MPETFDEPDPGAGATARVAPAGAAAEVAEALKYGPRGALFIASVAVGLLFAGWLAFYFFLFLPRGTIG